MPQYDYELLVCETGALFTTDAYAYTAVGNVVNFGVTQPDCGKAGKFGLHVVINTAFTASLTSAQIWIVHGSGATPTTLLSGRYFTLAQLALAGAHYFIPCAPGLLQYASMYWDTTGTPGAGALEAWFGPDEDGTI